MLSSYGFLATVAYICALRAGWVSTDTLHDTFGGALRIATPMATAFPFLALAAWRWCPPLQIAVFPYLGGRWSGVLEFNVNGQPVQREARLEVSHNLMSIRFTLETDESTSETLVVHARKPRAPSNLAKLIYIYEVERKEGVSGAGDRYRGCAFIDVKRGGPLSMTGSYMAGSNRAGSIRMTLENGTSLWKLWK